MRPMRWSRAGWHTHVPGAGDMERYVAALGGHMGRVRRLADVLAEARPRAVVLPQFVPFPVP